MATLYVSKSTDNGLSVGDNGNAGTADAPKLTIASAITAASAGDTIKVNDGVYSETSIALNKALTLEPIVAYAVTLTSADASRTIHVTGNGCTIGEFIVDTNGVGGSAIRTSDAGDHGTHVRGTRCLVDGAYGVYFHAPFKMSGDWEVRAKGAISTNLVHAPAAAAGIIDISGGLISGLIDGGAGISCFPTVDGVTLKVSGTTIDISGDTATDDVKGVDCEGAETVLISDCDITLNDLNAGTGIIIGNDATIVTDKVRISGNDLILKGTPSIVPTGGYGILVGEEAAGGAGVDNIRVYGNTVNGFNHAVMFGGDVTDARAFSNRVSNSVISLICKLTDATSLMYGNLVTDPAGSSQVFRFKGATDSEIGNNTLEINTTYAGDILRVDEEGATDSTGVVFSNNSIDIKDAADFTGGVTVTASQTFTASNNNYYSGKGFPSAGFVVGSATTGFYEYRDDNEPTSTDSAPTNLPAGGKWWSNMRPVDLSGEPLPDLSPKIGAK